MSSLTQSLYGLPHNVKNVAGVVHPASQPWIGETEKSEESEGLRHQACHAGQTMATHSKPGAVASSTTSQWHLQSKSWFGTCCYLLGYSCPLVLVRPGKTPSSQSFCSIKESSLAFFRWCLCQSSFSVEWNIAMKLGETIVTGQVKALGITLDGDVFVFVTLATGLR